MGTGAGDRRAREHQRARRDDGDPGQPEIGWSDLWASRPLGLAGPPQQHHGVGDQQHRDHEVTAHRDGMEVHQHRDATQHDLGDDAGHQAERQPDQIPSVRATAERTQDGRHHRERDQAGEQAVDLLDGLVGVAELDQAFLAAVGPVLAPQPGARQADRGAGHDDDAEERQRDGDHGPIGARGQREPLGGGRGRHQEQGRAGDPGRRRQGGAGGSGRGRQGRGRWGRAGEFSTGPGRLAPRGTRVIP